MLIRSEALDPTRLVALKQALFDAFQPVGADGAPAPSAISDSAVSASWGGQITTQALTGHYADDTGYSPAAVLTEGRACVARRRSRAQRRLRPVLVPSFPPTLTTPATIGLMLCSNLHSDLHV